MKTILYVRLPCWKIYPGGLISIADYVHKHNPAVRQRIVELSIVDPARRSRYLKDVIRELRPDVIAFSWRNVQTFSPHDGTPSLESILKYDYSGYLRDKAYSAYTALRLVWDFIYQLHRNLTYIRQAGKLMPEAQLVVGGTAFSCFPEELIRRMPEGTIGIAGEGERAMLKIIEGRPIDDEETLRMSGGKLERNSSRSCIDLEEFTATDFPYIERIFPEFREFLHDEVGVQTKRGCPYKCSYCIYKIIEGSEERFRRSSVVVEDVAALARNYGVKRFWFTDSQFLSTTRTLPVVEATLEGIISKELDISWTGYLKIENITATAASLMIRSGITSFDLSFSGSQKIIDSLRLGYKIEKQMDSFRIIKDAGFTDQMVRLYIPFNAPGETRDTLIETISACRDLYGLFGAEQVHPWVFFLGIQAGTALEKSLIESRYLDPGYNPLSYNPLIIKKLLYNPPPLGELIGGSFLEAMTRAGSEAEAGRITLDILEKKLLAVG